MACYFGQIIFLNLKKINIKRSKMGSNFSLWAMSVYNQTSILEINNFIHHTLLINNENITKEEYSA